MRWLIYLLLYIPVQLFAWAITPLLPLFAELRIGPWDNNNQKAMGHRLPRWLSWFDTPDNALEGDSNWRGAMSIGYWSMVGWLYRNSLYGFKWSVLAKPIEQERKVYGDLAINYHTGHCGAFYIVQPNGAWQFKMVMPWNGGHSVINLGWLLDDASQKRALFMLSPRIK